MTLNFWTDRSVQIVQTQIRLLLEEKSDQGLHCLLFHLHVIDKIPSGLAFLFEFYVNYSKVSCVRKFRNFMVILSNFDIFSPAYQRFGERMNMQSDKELNDLLDFSAVSHINNTPMQYTAIFHGCKKFIFK